MSDLKPKEERIVAEILASHEPQRSQIIPVLQEVQDKFGYVPRGAMTRIAKHVRVPVSTVYGVVTFYAQFYLKRRGKHTVKVCRGTACHVKGSKDLMDTLSRKLNVEPGGTTKDYRFNLERVACFGSCALAPVMVVDDKVYGNMTPRKAEKILDAL